MGKKIHLVFKILGLAGAIAFIVSRCIDMEKSVSIVVEKIATMTPERIAMAMTMLVILLIGIFIYFGVGFIGAIIRFLMWSGNRKKIKMQKEMEKQMQMQQQAPQQPVNMDPFGSRAASEAAQAGGV